VDLEAESAVEDESRLSDLEDPWEAAAAAAAASAWTKHGTVK
jgi:hypothetical protein